MTIIKIKQIFFFFFRAAIEEQLGKALVKLAKTLLIRGQCYKTFYYRTNECL